MPNPALPPSRSATGTKLAAFLADRPDNYFRASAPKAGIGLLPQVYGSLPTPTVLELTETPRLTLWDTLKLFGEKDAPLPAPYAAMLFPAVTVTSYPPRFARLGAAPSVGEGGDTQAPASPDDQSEVS